VLQVDLSLKDRQEAINNSVATNSWEAVALQEVDNPWEVAEHQEEDSTILQEVEVVEHQEVATQEERELR
jgi:hypothetical protein